MEYKFINREISWLQFNERVLQEACDPNVPLLQRLQFLGIFSNNQDEFFKVRVANIMRLCRSRKNAKKMLTGDYTPESLLEELNDKIALLQEHFSATYRTVLAEMERESIFVVNEKNLSEEQKEFCRSYFAQILSPRLVPLIIRKSVRLPFLPDGNSYLGVKMSHKNRRSVRYAVVRIPTSSACPRFVVLPSAGGRHDIIFIDDIIRLMIDHIFFMFSYDEIGVYTFKIMRDAELTYDEDVSKSLFERISEGVSNRRYGLPIRMIYDRDMPADMVEILAGKLGLDNSEMLAPGERYHMMKDLMKFPKVRPDLLYAPQRPIQHPSISLFSSILEVIARRDIFLNYPYHTFQHFIDFLREAAIDPRVESIYITLYRTAEHSKVINALVNAVKNGKKVYAMLELKARFDEEQNMENTDLLQREGVKILHTMEDLKVHSKVVLVERRERRGMKRYAYIGTGNFNENTALIYSDFGLFTSHDEITEDVLNVFLFLSNNHKQFTFKHLMVSPYYMRMQFVDMIDREISHAKKGKKAYIYAKCNSLTDVGIIEKLYEAGRAGVEVRLIVRGACCLLPQVEAMSENIRAISIVDKYLEHARLYIFCNGGDERIYTGSADWMARNLDRRVEVCVPLYDEGIRKKARDVFEIQWHDTVKARLLDEDRQNTYVKPAPGAAPLRSQTALYDYYGRLSNYKK